jgi:hypothetical protein
MIKQQTAVDWLYNSLKEYVILEDVKDMFNQAKEMQRKQIIEAFNAGTSDWLHEQNNENYVTGKQYYKETYEP